MNFLLPAEHFLCHVSAWPVPVHKRKYRIRDSKEQKFHGKGSGSSGTAGNQTATRSFAATTSPLTLLGKKTNPKPSLAALPGLYLLCIKGQNGLMGFRWAEWVDSPNARNIQLLWADGKTAPFFLSFWFWMYLHCKLREVGLHSRKLKVSPKPVFLKVG